jgi:hypothetical protein
MDHDGFLTLDSGISDILPIEQRCHQYLPRDAQMLRYVVEDGTQCTDAQRTVMGNCDMMLTLLHRGKAQMTACLARYLVAIAPEKSTEFLAADISW